MAISSLLTKRFFELEMQLKAVEATVYFVPGQFAGNRVEGDTFLNWKVKAKNLLSSACGADSPHYQHFLRAEKRTWRTNYDELKDMKAVFLAAKEDYEGGYLMSVRAMVQADVFTTELEQASELLSNQYVVAAAVVAGVVLETALRQLCSDKGISAGKLNKMNDDLVKAGAYHQAVAKRVGSFAEIRNNAAHGHPEHFKPDDVKEMISYIERFLSEHL